MKNEEEDFYCLVQCDCGRKYKPLELYICFACKKVKCPFCIKYEGQLFLCRAGCQNQYTTNTKIKYSKFCCVSCMECPICFSPLSKKILNGKYYLSCPACYWNSFKVHIAKSKAEDFNNYIQRMNEETNNGFLKRMYNSILNKLSNDPFIKNITKKIDLDDEDKYNDIVKKAMEEGEHNFEKFEESNILEINEKEKQETGKYEYNDDYINNEENKYISLKIINKILPCYTDYTQNFNTLEEVQKAFNTNDLSLNNMIGLEQRHNNPIIQNNSVLDQYPRFMDLVPKKQCFSKKCKECGAIIVEEEEDSQKQSRIVQDFLSKLPITYINKIDLENNLIKLRFVLMNFNSIIISFKEDKKNKVKVILPEGKFDFDEAKAEELKTSKYKSILVDFKFDESYKNELTSKSCHFLRFIVRVDFNKGESENQKDNSENVIEYQNEIKFIIQ